MTYEGQNTETKSLRKVTKANPDWDELARDCVAYANAQGGRLLIGIEDGHAGPPAGQRIPAALVDRVRQRLGQLTVNVTVAVQKSRCAGSTGEYLEVVVPRALAPASTTDGRYYLRVGDESRPLVGAEVQRLLDERGARPWETLTTLQVPKAAADPRLVAGFAAGIRASSRVKDSVREKGHAELLEHYFLSIGEYLTNLGVLCVGRSEHRALTGTAPVVQCIKYDDGGRKVHKIAWDDHSRSPMELVDAVWAEVADFREYYELPDGLLRQQVPAYDPRVVRELLVNALVHRAYTQQGDIYLNLRPDSLEVVSPGRLPLGVTPGNILHQSVRRNNELARVFHDLGLMEREGSGYDMLYEVLLSQGRPLPELTEGTDSVHVVVRKRIARPELVDLVEKTDQQYGLRQRERIALGLLAQHEALSARELAATLDLRATSDVSSWIGRLQEWGIVRQTGRTKATRYYVDPLVLRRLEFPSRTSLARIEPHRLEALILEDLGRYPGSAIGTIHGRVGPEIPRRQVKGALRRLCSAGQARGTGLNRGRRYWPVDGQLSP